MLIENGKTIPIIVSTNNLDFSMRKETSAPIATPKPIEVRNGFQFNKYAIATPDKDA